MNGERHVTVNRFRAAQELLDHLGVRVLAHHAGELDDDRRARPCGAAEQPMKLLEIADIESAERVSTIRKTHQASRGKSHNERLPSVAAPRLALAATSGSSVKIVLIEESFAQFSHCQAVQISHAVGMRS